MSKCRLILQVLSCAALVACVGAPSANADPSAWWQLTSNVAPSRIAPEGKGLVSVRATNLGDAELSGASTPVTITDRVPAGFEIAEIYGESGDGLHLASYGKVTCTKLTTREAQCVYREVLPEYQGLRVELLVKALPGAVSGESNEATITGGESYLCSPVAAGRYTEGLCREEGAGGQFEKQLSGSPVPAVSIDRALNLGTAPSRLEVEEYKIAAESEGGAPVTQAGAHPFQFTTTMTVNRGELKQADPGEVAVNEFRFPPGAEMAQYRSEESPAPVKDLHFNLPPGLIGNPAPFPQCSETAFLTIIGGRYPSCPADTAVGVTAITLSHLAIAFGLEYVYTVPASVYNLVPSEGEPARFGFIVPLPGNVPVIIDTAVRTGRAYEVVAEVKNISEIPDFMASTLTLWGVPGDPRHDAQRGLCIEPTSACKETTAANPPPLMTLPTSCTGPLRTSVEVDSWSEPGLFTTLPASGEPLESMGGCNRLPFAPSIGVAPDTSAASSPTGLAVDIHVPQEEGLNPRGLSPSDVRDIAVTLPEGVALNPGAADGLQACSPELAGFAGSTEIVPGVQAPSFAEMLPTRLQQGVNFCPDASKIATVKIHSPLLPNPLEGAVYLATQNENPFGSLVAMYLVASDPVSGTHVELPGEVSLNQQTGQITATFADNPQLPFEDAELHFFGGERAPLTTPARCGAYTTTAVLTPWSGNEPVKRTSTFNIETGPDGHPCAGASLPFSPSLTAGTTSIQAGGFSPFTMTVSREDGQQNIQGIQLHMPAGLSGLLTGVELCGEAQADAGTCGPGSLIGETTVSVGLGGEPYSVTGGKVYITGAYEGAPFGVSVVVPAKAGPYNLGQVIVRGTIAVNPITAALTVTTNSQAQGDAIPHILDGIPLQIKHVNFVTTRPGFTFNPTNCDPMGVTGNVSSVEGASSPVSVPFQATNCATLQFAPKLSVSTSGKTSKANGASLAVKLTYPKAPFGSQANIARVKVDLPKQLPSRLTTLQKACTAVQFEANPAGCPAASVIGHAKAITPLVPVPLEGPAYFVSHGGEAFPSLIVVLQGYGVKIDLVGTTFISKAGITSSTFRTVPDAPVGSFELTLPEGKYSALAANGNLCGKKLAMPTAFVAQNGAKINESTKIAVTGCSKAKKKVKKKVKADGRKGGKGKK